MTESDIDRLERGKTLMALIKSKSVELIELESSDLICFTSSSGNYEVRYDRDGGRQTARYALQFKSDVRKSLFLRFKEQLMGLLRTEIAELQKEFDAL